MQLPPGMVAVAALSGLVAAVAAVLLTVVARRRHRAAPAGTRAARRRPPVVALLSLLAGVVAALSANDHWAHEQGQRTGWATVVAIGTAVSGLTFAAGLLRLPGVAATAARTARLALDGLVMAAALWFVGWVLFSEPTRLLGAATPMACPAILLATVSAALGAGLAVIVVFRAAHAASTARRAGRRRSAR